MLWISDKQNAFLKCVATEFPGVPHRYCENHFFRDLAKPVLDLDSTAKTKMRAKIRGLRALEREILEAREAAARPSSAGRKRKSSLVGTSGDVVLDYCSAVRGILNDNHGGPAHPTGLRMLEALGDVQKSLSRVGSSGKVGPAIDLLARLKGFIDRGVADQQIPFHSRASVHPTGASRDEVADCGRWLAAGKTQVAICSEVGRVSTSWR